MDWGMENRLNQLMPNGRCFFMPIDHGYFQGPTTGLVKPGETMLTRIFFGPNSRASVRVSVSSPDAATVYGNG